MKKIILLVLFGLPLSAALIAQPRNLSLDEQTEDAIPARPAALVPAFVKAESAFMRHNPDVSGVKWYDHPKGYFAYYLKDGKRGRSFYDRKGNFVYSAVSYEADRLSQRMKDWILTSFDVKMKITHINEIRQQAKTIYLVTVTDDKVWKKLRIEGDELEVIDSYKAG